MIKRNHKPREHTRVKTGDRYEAKLLLADDVSIKDISSGGILLETSKRLNINSKYRVQIGDRNSKKIKPLAVVIRESLKGSIKRKYETAPLYEVAMKFTELTENERSFLNDLIVELR